LDGLAIDLLGFGIALRSLEHFGQAGAGEDILGEALDGLATDFLGFGIALRSLEHSGQAGAGDDILGEALARNPGKTEGTRYVLLLEEHVFDCGPGEGVVRLPTSSLQGPAPRDIGPQAQNPRGEVAERVNDEVGAARGFRIMALLGEQALDVR